jgi:hypothetical protein
MSLAFVDAAALLLAQRIGSRQTNDVSDRQSMNWIKNAESSTTVARLASGLLKNVTEVALSQECGGF